jgi:CRP-like cAMP-binding protein
MHIPEDLYSYLRLFHPLAEQDFQLLKQSLKEVSFPKGTILVRPGEVQDKLYFIKSGVQMSFLETDQHTHVIAFTYPPNPCAIPESFALQQPSPYFLQCLSPSTMDWIGFAKLQSLFDQSQALERLFRKMCEHMLAGIISRHVDLHALPMEERFLGFCRRSPQLLHTVPHKYLASYLNMDPTNFSKLFNQVRI